MKDGIELDQVDRRLLLAIEQNAGLSQRELAERVDVS
jgi:DNA-binding Lrp family transcriptional regulator